MKANVIRTSRRSRLGNWSMSQKVLIITSMLAATAAVSLGASAGSAAATKANATPGLGASLSQLVAAGAPGATLLVRQGDRTTLLARGFAETASKKRMRPGDSFRIGSLTKTYVATLVLQLAEEGRLSLDDHVSHFLPGLVPGGDKITIRQLLNQTSGQFDYENDPRVLAPALAGNLAYRWAPRKLVRIAVSHRPLFKPGARWSYSNTNYILAGLIVEAATGATLERVLDRRLFMPLHLRRTAFQRSARMPVPDAHGYYVFDKPPATDITGLSPYPWAAGALVANAADVASFYRALLSGRLFNAGSLRALKTTVGEGKKADLGARYGLGIERLVTPCGIAWGHSGNMPGYNVYALSSTNGDKQVVLSINLDTTSMPKRLKPMFGRLLIGAFCSR
jgi:D-alanyl-D-alanine carboxypeptidase